MSSSNGTSLAARASTRQRQAVIIRAAAPSRSLWMTDSQTRITVEPSASRLVVISRARPDVAADLADRGAGKNRVTSRHLR